MQYDPHPAVQLLTLPINTTYHVGDEGASTQTARCKRQRGRARQGPCPSSMLGLWMSTTATREESASSAPIDTTVGQAA